MRRIFGHVSFAIVAAVLGAVTLGECLRLERALQINTALKDAAVPPSVPSTLPSSTMPAPAAPAPNSTPSAIPTAQSIAFPEARLAHAVMLAKTDYDGALASYQAIIQSNREDLRRLALYDIGNLHLRQALHATLSDDAQSLPLTELAKQSYRTLLRRDPTDWAARYNLERALRLTPEADDDAETDNGPPDPGERQRSTVADPRMDLP